MEHGASPNLLDESMGLLAGQVVLLEDSVEISASFVLHHLLKRSLSPQSSMSSSSSPSITLSLTTIASSESSVATWLLKGTIIDSFSLTCLCWNVQVSKSDGDREKTSGGGLIALYGKIQKVISALPQERKNSVTIMIDDVSLMEVAAKGSTNLIIDFLHYCNTLTSELGCSLVVLNHEDIYSSTERPSLILQMEYLAGVVIKAEPLATGLAADVHGQLTVLNRGIYDRQGSRYKSSNFHFKVRENSVEYFYPGSRT